MKVTILGSGVFGTALAFLLRENGHSVSFWQRGERETTSEVVVIAIPAQAIREVFNTLELSKETAIVNCAKGIEKQSHMLPYAILQALGFNNPYYALMGPSFAKGIIAKMPMLVNLGYQEEKNAASILSLFQTPHFKVKLTPSLQALELAAALKNIYAIAAGIAHGLGYDTNTRVNLMMLGIEEIEELALACRFPIDMSARPGIMGDMILSCSSSESRNFSFGKLLVHFSPKDALKQIGGTVEGYNTVASVGFFQKKTQLALPLAQFVTSAVSVENPSQIQRLFKQFVHSV